MDVGTFNVHTSIQIFLPKKKKILLYKFRQSMDYSKIDLVHTLVSNASGPYDWIDLAEINYLSLFLNSHCHRKKKRKKRKSVG